MGEVRLVLEQFKAGDLILADKGFTIYDKLPAEVCLNIPPFLAAKSHCTKAEHKCATKLAAAEYMSKEQMLKLRIMKYYNISLLLTDQCQ